MAASAVTLRLKGRLSVMTGSAEPSGPNGIHGDRLRALFHFWKNVLVMAVCTLKPCLSVLGAVKDDNTLRALVEYKGFTGGNGKRHSRDKYYEQKRN